MIYLRSVWTILIFVSIRPPLALALRPPHPLFHFGMTGAFTVEGERRHKFVKFKVGSEWPPRFTKLELEVRCPSPLTKVPFPVASLSCTA